MTLNAALNSVVREWGISLLHTEKLCKICIRENLPSVSRVLKILFPDVLTDVLRHVNARLEFARVPTGELCHLLGDGNLLQKPRVSVGAPGRLLSHNLDRLGLERLDLLVEALEEATALALRLSQLYNF